MNCQFTFDFKSIYHSFCCPTAAFTLGLPRNSCSLVFAHDFLQSLMISVLLIVVKILSLSAPFGGGLVSLNTHFETHSSYFLSVIVPAPLSAARVALLKVRRQLVKAIEIAPNLLATANLSFPHESWLQISGFSSTLETISSMIFTRDPVDFTLCKPSRLRLTTFMLLLEKASQTSKKEPRTAEAISSEQKAFIAERLWHCLSYYVLANTSGIAKYVVDFKVARMHRQ